MARLTAAVHGAARDGFRLMQETHRLSNNGEPYVNPFHYHPAIVHFFNGDAFLISFAKSRACRRSRWPMRRQRVMRPAISSPPMMTKYPRTQTPGRLCDEHDAPLARGLGRDPDVSLWRRPHR